MIPEWPSPKGATRLYLIRHAEPDKSVHGRVVGRLDPGLSPAGHAQARALATWLGEVPLAAVYASPLRRALETAAPLCTAREPHTVDALREIDFGAFEGMTYDDIAKANPALYRAWMEGPTEVMFPEGESFAGMRVRVLGAVQRIVADHPNACVALVAHGGTHRVVLGRSLCLADREVFRLDLAHASLSVVDVFSDTFSEPALVRLLNGRA